MIRLWNRKEVFVGFSIDKFNEVLDILNRNNIQYKYKIINRNHLKQQDIGTNWEDTKYSGVYYVYVHKKDYDNVRTLLGNSNII
ncbi:MAG: hypothetical protein GX209_07150 [Epulopiscium sp.]|jgi:putative IMPACT (imprinted ancient) family translation regulator|nr:hypothetical protein [Candidatus Epulonipiscium sp.]